MEDHKRKNRKRNQNKKPTNEQIKKIQQSIDRRSSTSDSNKVIHNGHTSNNHQPIQEKNNLTKIEPQHNDSNASDVKQKKGNRRRRNRSRAESGEILSVNGHPEADVCVNQTEAIEKTKNDNLKNEIDTVSAVTQDNSTLITNQTESLKISKDMTQSILNLEETIEPTQESQTDVDNTTKTDFKLNVDVQNHLSPLMSRRPNTTHQFFFQGFNAPGNNTHFERLSSYEFGNGNLPEKDFEVESDSNLLTGSKESNNTFVHMRKSLKDNVNLMQSIKEMMQTSNEEIENNNSENVIETHVEFSNDNVCRDSNKTSDLFDRINKKLEGNADFMQKMAAMMGGLDVDSKNLKLKDESLSSISIDNHKFPDPIEINIASTSPVATEPATAVEANEKNDILKNNNKNLESNSDFMLSIEEMMQNGIPKNDNQTNNLFGNMMEALGSVKIQSSENKARPKNSPGFTLPSPEFLSSLLGGLGPDIPDDCKPQLEAESAKLITMLQSVNDLTKHIEPHILCGMNSMVAIILQDNHFQTFFQNQTPNVHENSAQITELSEETKHEVHIQNSDTKEKSNETFNKNEGQIECTTISENIEMKDHEIVNINFDEKITRMSNSVETITNLDFSVGSPFDAKSHPDTIEESSDNDFTAFKNVSQDYEAESLSERVEQMENLKSESSPRRKIRFHRDESIPELIDTLIKEKNSENNEIKIARGTANGKSGRIKTFFQKVLRRERKVIVEDETQKYEYHERRVDYDESGKKMCVYDATTTVEGNAANYRNILQVKEPQEINRHSIEETDFLKKRIEHGEKNETFVKSGFQKNKNNEDFSEKQPEVNSELRDDFGNLGLENVTKFPTNDMPENMETNTDVKEKFQRSDQQNKTENKDPFLDMMETMSKMMGGQMRHSGNSGQSSNNVLHFTDTPDNVIHTNQETNHVSDPTNKQAAFENLMSSMLTSMSSLNCGGTNGDGPSSNPSQTEALTNLMGQLGSMLSDKTQNLDNASSAISPLQNINSIFEQMLGSNKLDEGLIPELFDMNTFPDFQKPENIQEILQIGETLFGNSLFGPDLNLKSNESKQSASSSEKLIDNINTIQMGQETEQNEIIKNESVPSRNVFQEDRTSVLLKNLLGDKFWNIRKIRTQSKHSIEPISTKELSKNPSSSQNKRPSSSKKEKTKSKDLPDGLESENVFVQKLQKKIQKDSKLQIYLKEKLQKDPKMQKFIQEKLQKDERLQKFIRDKLSNDKELRKNFEEKFKSELGLTGIIPKFDDDDDDDEGMADTRKGKSDQQNNKEVKKVSKRKDTTERQIDVPNLENDEDKKDGKPKKDIIITTNEKTKRTLLLMKRYFELTFTIVGIIYLGLICY